MSTDAISARAPALEVRNLNVYYGRAHALQDISLTLPSGVLGVVGRNGMGKTTLCNAITGLVPARGSVKLAGREILGLSPNVITELGIGYVPQGRRVWASLSVDEHLRLAAKSARQGPWTVERIYSLFPRLADRRSPPRLGSPPPFIRPREKHTPSAVVRRRPSPRSRGRGVRAGERVS